MIKNYRKLKENDEFGVNQEKIRVIPLRYIDDFPDHPFKVKEDDEMRALMDSISQNGVVTPVIARLKPDGRYELISGHRRKYACKKLGISCLPLLLRDLSKEQAVFTMVDSNLQRERILPSEKAFAYKMKLEAVKCQGKRRMATSPPLVDKLCTGKENLSTSIIGKDFGDSHEQVRRYIRLTELTPELLQLVDEGRIGFRPAVELSYLKEEEQRDLLETIESEDSTPSLAQSLRMKKLSQEGKLDMDAIFNIMTEEKGNQKVVYKMKSEKIEKYFSPSATPKEVEETIIKALDFYRRWQRKREQERDER